MRVWRLALPPSNALPIHLTNMFFVATPGSLRLSPLCLSFAQQSIHATLALIATPLLAYDPQVIL